VGIRNRPGCDADAVPLSNLQKMLQNFATEAECEKNNSTRHKEPEKSN
jgi:hypothetical protein